VTDKETQGPLRSATSISRRRFLKESALASAVVAIPYLADKSVAFGKESTHLLHQSGQSCRRQARSRA
jgi:hypothetical protein